MSAFGFNTSFKARSPFFNCSINNQLLIKFFPRINDSFTKFFNVSNLCLVNFLLHYSPNLLIDRVQVRAVWWPKIRGYEIRSLPCQQLNSFTRSVGRSAILLKRVIFRTFPDIRQQLFRQQTIPVVSSIYFYSRFYEMDLCFNKNRDTNRNHD